MFDLKIIHQPTTDKVIRITNRLSRLFVDTLPLADRLECTKLELIITTKRVVVKRKRGADSLET